MPEKPMPAVLDLYRCKLQGRLEVAREALQKTAHHDAVEPFPKAQIVIELVVEMLAKAQETLDTEFLEQVR